MAAKTDTAAIEYYPAATADQCGARRSAASAAAERSLWGALYEISGNAGRLRSMEGARGIAVLLVFFVHFHALFGEYAKGIPVLWAPSQFLGLIGNTGVDVFFVISGYLIYGALIRRKAGFAKFIWRRMQRIYPTFLAVFGLYLVLSVLFPEENKIHGSPGAIVAYVLANLLLLPGLFDIKPIITVAWSLSYEFSFYLLLPLIVWATRMWRWRPLWRAGFFSAVWISYMAYSFSASRSHVRTLMFVVGIILYEALASARFKHLLSRRGEVAVIALFAASIGICYLLDAHQDMFSRLPGWTAGRNPVPGVLVYQGPYKTIMLSLSCFWLAAYCFHFDGWLNRIGCWRPLRYLGNMSYSYYLIHGVTLQGLSLAFLFAGARGAHPALWFAGLLAGFAATWASSTALFALVEKPASLQRRPAAAPLPLAAEPERPSHA